MVPSPNPSTRERHTAAALVLVLAALVAPASAAEAPAVETPENVPMATPAKRPSFFSGFKKLFKPREAPPAAAPAAPADVSKPAEPAAKPAPEPDRAPSTAKVPAEAEGIDLEARVNKYVVTEDRLPFYKNGPLQAHGADKLLKTGAMVTLVKLRKGWSDVLLEDGTFGTLPSDAIRKALASDFPVEPLDIDIDLSGSGRVASRGARFIDNAPQIPVVPPPLPVADDAGSLDVGSDLLINPLLLPPGDLDLPDAPELEE